jgi:hypothetical protein
MYEGDGVNIGNRMIQCFQIRQHLFREIICAKIIGSHDKFKTVCCIPSLLMEHTGVIHKAK